MESRRRGRSFWVIAGAALLLCAGGAAALVQRKNPFIDRSLSGPVTLKGGEWLELSPDAPLKAVRDTQEITLHPDPPIQMVFKKDSADLIPSDGRAADIEAELVDDEGVTHRSRPGVSERMTGDLRIVSRSLVFKDLPKDASFKTVRIRSSAAYPVKKILWRCYNWGEAHH